jgi:hypothetical protein
VGQYAFREALPAKTQYSMAALWRNLVNLSDEIEDATKTKTREDEPEPDETRSRRSTSKISSKSKTIKKTQKK